ncbi:MAG: protein kinase [Verrucomicrobiaceae bacterium]|nr:protein kinase [Verrucomicrobiaceae bacterium]
MYCEKADDCDSFPNRTERFKLTSARILLHVVSRRTLSPTPVFGWDLRFEVLEKIGTGAMGQVWRAREIATGRIVALKMIDPARTGDEQTLARLEIEGETLTKLREAGAHEHVVPILDFKITEEHACLVMEFIPGLNLKKWCSTHQLNLTDRDVSWPRSPELPGGSTDSASSTGT